MSVDTLEIELPPGPAHAGMSMDVVWEVGRARITVRGELDAATAPRLRRCLSELAELGVHDFALDMGAVSFLDCAGLGALVSAKKRLRVTGGDIGIISASRNVRRVLTLTGFAPAFGLNDAGGPRRPPAG